MGFRFEVNRCTDTTTAFHIIHNYNNNIIHTYCYYYINNAIGVPTSSIVVADLTSRSASKTRITKRLVGLDSVFDILYTLIVNTGMVIGCVHNIVWKVQDNYGVVPAVVI